MYQKIEFSKNKQQETHDGKTSFESNNSTVADIHTDPDNINLVESPSICANKTKSSAQIDQNTQRSSSQSERKIRFVRESWTWRMKTKLPKQILSHVDKMIVKEGYKD